METSLSPERLLAIIETQNQISASALDLDAVMREVVARAQSLTAAAAAVVELAEGDEMVYHVATGTAAAHVGLRLRIDTSLSGRCVLEERVLHCRDAGDDPRVDAEACLRVGALSLLCVPLSHHDEVIGVLKVYDPRAFAFDDGDVETLQLLSGVIASHMAHANDFARHRHESRHDALTGLLNRRAFDERLRAEISRIRRHGGSLTLCLFDLDGFKQVNDTLGHAAGDELLRAVGRAFVQVRSEDAAFRLGGDEFALLLLEAPTSGGVGVVDRVCARVQGDPACRGVRLSRGVATLRQGDDPATLLARADGLMYADKRRKREERDPATMPAWPTPS